MLLYCCYGTIMRQWYALGLKFSNVHACFWKLESVCLALNECRFFHYSCLFSVPCTHGTCGAGYGFANCLHCSSEQSQRRCGCWQGCKVCCQRKATISRSVGADHGCWDLSTSFSFSSCQPSLVGWQAGQRDIPTSCHEFNALFSLIPKGQGSLMEEGIACCESPLVQGLLEEGAAFDREHGMPETAF